MKTISAALLSYGMSGQVFHAPFIHLHPGFTLLGSWERSAKKIQQHYPEVTSYASLEAVLSDERVDMVVVNTPNHTHYIYAKKVLEAGKHAVVEKAFTATTDQAIELKNIADKKGLKLFVCQNRRWDSDFGIVRRVIEQGLIGDVVEANFGFLRYAPELSPKAHKETPSEGAGILKDLGPHLIDQALFLFGMPLSVFADIAITRPHSEVDDYFDLSLIYQRFRVHLKGGYFFREPGPSYVIHGTRGTFTKSRGDVQEDQLKSGMQPDHPDYGREPDSEEGFLHTELDGKIIREHVRTPAGDYKIFYEGIYQAIVNDQAPPVSAQDGVRIMKIIEAAIDSDRTGMRIAID